MSNYLETIDLDLAAESAAGIARQQVLASLPWAPTPTTNVSYNASSRVLIIGSGEQVEVAREGMASPIETFVVDPLEPRFSGVVLSGYLGRFSVQLPPEKAGEGEDAGNVGVMLGVANGLFDHVIDLGVEPMLTAAIKPPGYYYAGSDNDKLVAAMTQIPELIGEFEKPRYFDYDPGICAHGRSGIKGCQRCIEACPTDAIISIGETIEVNPYLCQGGGSCTASCPSGAISYRYPRAEEQIEFLRQMIRDMREKRDARGVSLLIYDGEHGEEMVQAIKLPEHILPLAVEEIGSVGLDLLASALAYGANRISLLVPDSVSDQVKSSVARDCVLLGKVLTELDLLQFHLQTLADPQSLVAEQEDEARFARVATYAGVGNKRSLIRNAMEFFHEMSTPKPHMLPLPDNSIFGEVELNDSACTLCMGCVSVCPGSALEAGGESPALKFIEANCLQCGLCTRACPENALTLKPRFVFDGVVAKRTRVLKEEEPFRCIKCNKAFATHAMIERMTEKLSGHWMFEKPEAMNRLRMCEDCRVADMFNETA